ncbi:4-cresol dehydrogenase [Bryobacterales bacterium F-183]|nr:4-cresol dehydrogenase [Bryobacterales bacterium F-183]
MLAGKAEATYEVLLDAAHDAWCDALGQANVLGGAGRFGADTSSFSGEIPFVLRPQCVEHVQAAMRIAQQFRVAVYPVSTGRNWGYGTAVPVRSPAVVMDLSGMNRIIDFDTELGVVTVQPGVTQGQLSEYLENNSLPFLVPVTGAGPTCSLLANALERGFGVTPMTDHFGAVVSMQVALPDGSLYESYTRSFSGSGLAQAYRWGTGPYLDGLFSQSNLGIVVDVSITLQRRSEQEAALLFVLDSNQQVEPATSEIRALLGECGTSIGGINLMSRARVSSMLLGAANLKGIDSPPAIPKGAWFGFGSVYGTRDHYRATCRRIQKRLRPIAGGIRFYTSQDARRLLWIADAAERLGITALTGMAERLAAATGVVAGVPSMFALPLAYAKSGRPLALRESMNPALDGCGLLWYSPLIPMRSGYVVRFLEFAEGTCAKHGLDAPITLTSLSARCYASTIPILFDRSSSESEGRAKACFEELVREGMKLGFVPYRMGAEYMHLLQSGTPSCGRLAQTLRQSLDRDGVLAPGRYSFD